MSNPIQYDRRSFIGTAATAMAATCLVDLRLPTRAPDTRDVRITQIDAGGLRLGYTEAGISNGPPVLVLHDRTARIDVDPLATRGYRVIVPETAAASDVMPLLAALGIETALVGGLGESARTAEVVAALWPQRLKCIAPFGGARGVYLAAAQRPLPPKEELAWWYRYYFVRASQQLPA